MALLTAGYWPRTYWPDNYWQTLNQYWLETVIVQTNRNKIVTWYLLEEARTWL